MAPPVDPISIEVEDDEGDHIDHPLIFDAGQRKMIEHERIDRDDDGQFQNRLCNIGDPGTE